MRCGVLGGFRRQKDERLALSVMRHDGSLGNRLDHFFKIKYRLFAKCFLTLVADLQFFLVCEGFATFYKPRGNCYIMYYTCPRLPSKHEMFNQFGFNVGPASHGSTTNAGRRILVILHF